MTTETRATISVALIMFALTFPAIDVSAQCLNDRSYVWSAEVVSHDAQGKAVTVKAPYQEHINRYISEFKRGDKVMLIWVPQRPGEAEAIIYVGRYESGAAVKCGYVLPVDFVSADTTNRSLTFSVSIPPKALKVLNAVPAGGRIIVTTPFGQPKDTATITEIEASAEPRNTSR